MNHILQTERLTLREFNTGDALFIVALLNSPGWLEFIGDRNVKTIGQAEEYLINGPIKSYQQNGFGLYMVEESTEGIAMGMCGLIKRDNLENPDIGFAFLPEYCNKGYAFEISDALMKFAAEKWSLNQILAITMPSNTSSIKLLEKIGMHEAGNYISATNETLLLFSN
jgi:RimJ/RimL family protein N-acetyltransferase